MVFSAPFFVFGFLPGAGGTSGTHPEAGQGEEDAPDRYSDAGIQGASACGTAGCGKTYLGCVPAAQACRHGLSVRYFRTSRLLEALSIAHGDGRFAKPIAQLAKTDLLILDDWGLEKMTLSQRNDLLEIMEDRHGLKSTLTTSQLPIAQWHKAIGDATLADAILDR